MFMEDLQSTAVRLEEYESLLVDREAALEAVRTA
jgi:hypothetical protein